MIFQMQTAARMPPRGKLSLPARSLDARQCPRTGCLGRTPGSKCTSSTSTDALPSPSPSCSNRRPPAIERLARNRSSLAGFRWTDARLKAHDFAAAQYPKAPRAGSNQLQILPVPGPGTAAGFLATKKSAARGSPPAAIGLVVQPYLLSACKPCFKKRRYRSAPSAGGGGPSRPAPPSSMPCGPPGPPGGGGPWPPGGGAVCPPRRMPR